MTQEEILEGNKLIAEFIGFVLNYIDEEKTMPYYIHNEKYLSNPPSTILLYKGEELQFHSSWDWLMPVVEKIESINITDENYYAVNIRYDECCIESCADDYWIAHSLPNQSKLTSTYKATVEFIKWYNLNNK